MEDNRHLSKDIPDWNKVIRIGVRHHIPQLVKIGELNKMRDLRELRKR